MTTDYVLDAEKIASNWEKFQNLCRKLGDRTDAVSEMLRVMGDRMILCPASGRLEYHMAAPGGLIDHSLRVLKNVTYIAGSMMPELDVSKESLILVSLFHDLGKCGSVETPYYIPQASDWHRKNLGETFVVNKDLKPFMTTAHRSLCTLQRFGVLLTEDEFVAILAHDGQFVDENKPYAMRENPLGAVLSTADFLACKQEKMFTVRT